MFFLLELTGDVGSDSFNASKVRKELSASNGKPVDVMIDSFGGYLNEGLSISGAFRDHGQVTVHLRGMIASAATIASMGAKKISMAPEALYLVHKASLTFLDWASRNADQLEDFISELQHTKENLDAMDKAIAQTYASRCKKPVADLLELMKGERWLSAQETLEWGFIDEIQSPVESSETEKPDKARAAAISAQVKALVSPAPITREVADQIVAHGLPLPPVAIIEPDLKNESLFDRIKNNIVSPIVSAISSLKSSEKMPNQTSNSQDPQNTNPAPQNNASPVNTTQDNSTQAQTPAQEPQPQSQSPQNSAVDDLAALRAENERLRAQLAAAPGAVTKDVTAQAVAPKAQTPDSPFAQYLRTCKTAQDLYDRIP